MQTRNILTLGALIGLLFYSSVAGAQTITDVVPERELRVKVQLWQKARSDYYSTFYAKRIEFRVAEPATDSLMKQYQGWKLSGDLSKAERSLARAVIQLNLEAILNGALYESIVARYKAPAFFIIDLTAGKVQDVLIELKHLNDAVQRTDCRTIPCDPKKCPPDECERRIFQRFTQ